MNSEISFRSVATLQDFEGALWWASTIQENNGVVPEDLRALFNRWCAENDLHKRQRRPWMRTNFVRDWAASPVAMMAGRWTRGTQMMWPSGEYRR